MVYALAFIPVLLWLILLNQHRAQQRCRRVIVIGNSNYAHLVAAQFHQQGLSTLWVRTEPRIQRLYGMEHGEIAAEGLLAETETESRVTPLRPDEQAALARHLNLPYDLVESGQRAFLNGLTSLTPPDQAETAERHPSVGVSLFRYEPEMLPEVETVIIPEPRTNGRTVWGHEDGPYFASLIVRADSQLEPKDRLMVTVGWETDRTSAVTKHRSNDDRAMVELDLAEGAYLCALLPLTEGRLPAVPFAQQPDIYFNLACLTQPRPFNWHAPVLHPFHLPVALDKIALVATAAQAMALFVKRRFNW